MPSLSNVSDSKLTSLLFPCEQEDIDAACDVVKRRSSTVPKSEKAKAPIGPENDPKVRLVLSYVMLELALWSLPKAGIGYQRFFCLFLQFFKHGLTNTCATESKPPCEFQQRQG